MLTLVWVWVIVFVLLVFLSSLRLISWLAPLLWCFPLLLLVVLVVLASRVRVNEKLAKTQTKPMGIRVDPRLYDFTSGLRRPRRK